MIKAIETRYKGYRFRSRLEARWAVFFDALGIEWQYEPEGFELPDGTRYLPDFWLPWTHPSHPGSGFWVEIKAVKPTASESVKAHLLAILSGHSVLLFPGAPGDAAEIYFGRDWQIYHGRKSRMGINLTPLPWTRWVDDEGQIFAAFAAAKSARFEHGQNGAG